MFIIDKSGGGKCKETIKGNISEWKKKKDAGEEHREEPGLSLLWKSTEAINNCFGNMHAMGGLPFT